MAIRRPALRSASGVVSAAGSQSDKSSLGPGALRARVARFAVRVRGRHLFVVDTIGIGLGALAALAIDDVGHLRPDALPSYLPLLAVLLSSRLALNARLGLYARVWRFASVADLGRIITSGILGTVVVVSIGVFASIASVDWWYSLPTAVWLTELTFSLAVLGTARFGIRAASDWATLPALTGESQPRRTLLYGAGRTGVLVARAARRKPGAGLTPIGFLDDDQGLTGTLVDGLPVFGQLDALGSVVEATGARILLITMPRASGNAVRRVVELGTALGLDVRTVPSVVDMLDGTVDAYRIRRVRVEDLLRRPTVAGQSQSVRDIVTDRVVLVTGAGGSIGSELARQLFALGPERLVLVDRAESPLYLVQRELETRARRGNGHGRVSAHLANVASRTVMSRLIEQERPDVIFHAAAYKHVPMMEEHPSDAVHVNIGGTLSILDAAAAAGVERVVLVSTDKAVRPSSVMGASKRIAEMLVADAALSTGRAYVSVRFGNVLGSTGSVVPIFQEQLENGEPLTITHPNMTRFFMTIPEASALILEAAALGEAGDLFVLDMGEPVRIVELARDLVRLAGRDPDSQPMEIVGLRPGEKMHEELFYDDERVEPTEAPRVLRAVAAPPGSDIRSKAEDLLRRASGEHEDDLRDAVLAIAHGLEDRGSNGSDLAGALDPFGSAQVNPVALETRDRSRGPVEVRN